MSMYDIAIKLCDLPDGNYNVETKIGNIEVASVWLKDSTNYRIVNILINGKPYTEITYTNFDYFKLYERINFENDEKPYKLTHHLVDCRNNKIEYTNKSGIDFEISDEKVINRSEHNITYNIQNNIVYKNDFTEDEIGITYNLETDEKVLLLKRNTNNKRNITKQDFVSLHGDVKDLVLKYNELIRVMNKNTSITAMNSKIPSKSLYKLVDSYAIPLIDIEWFQKLDEQIDEYVKIYKEFSTKLHKYHSDEMLEILEHVATTLHKKYNKSKQEVREIIVQSNKKEKKLLNISKFKNN